MCTRCCGRSVTTAEGKTKQVCRGMRKGLVICFSASFTLMFCGFNSAVTIIPFQWHDLLFSFSFWSFIPSEKIRSARTIARLRFLFNACACEHLTTIHWRSHDLTCVGSGNCYKRHRIFWYGTRSGSQTAVPKGPPPGNRCPHLGCIAFSLPVSLVACIV